MKRLQFCAIAVLLLCLQVFAQDAKKPEPPILGPHWVRGVHIRPSGTNPDMTYHGGNILPSVTTQAIFWGISWGTPGDKISGMDLWYAGEGTVSGGGGSSYAATVNEYTDSASTNNQVTTAITYGGHIVDTTAVPKHIRTSAVLAEVCKVVPSPVANGYYPVYVDRKRGGANYCAYHSWGSCNGTPVEFGFFFNLDSDAGCDPQSTVNGQSQGLAALANVTGHELSETRSDPNGNAWYDSSGAENADKCAWTFGGSYVTFTNGTHWKIQGNWSNYAYDHSNGYPRGCVDGTNYPGPYNQ